MTDPARTSPTPATPDEEFVPVDDAIIGRAFRWSLLAIVGVAAVAGGTAWWLSRDTDAPMAILPKDPGTIAPLDRTDSMLPAVTFTDVTATAGIDFVHHNGATGQKLLPETMGAGAAFFDIEGDGDADLLLVDGTTWPWDAPPGTAVTPVLYRNDGHGRFENITAASGLDISLYGQGVACGDYDGDGRVDLYLTAVGRNRLFRNTPGGFVEVTDGAGVAGPDDMWSTSAAFFDADGDEDLDLFVCNYVEWSRAIDLELAFTLNGTDRAYGPPTNYRGTFPVLYRNDGDGTFTDVSADAGLHVRNPATDLPVGKSLAVVPIDIDRDGDLDLVVANDTTANFLFENRGDGTFIETGAASGLAYSGMGESTGAMGIDAAYFRNDDDLAVGIGNFANEMTSFYVKQAASSQFSDDAIVEGIGSPTRIVLSFGLFFFDYDLDGRLDLLQANGHLEEEINQLQASQHYRQPAQLFWNRGREARTTFVEAPAETIGDLARPIVGRGATFADIDGDGDLDVLLTQVGGPPLLLRNDQASGHHWLRVRLANRAPNVDAVGAWIVLRADGRTQRRQVMPARSYLSQVELPVTFGLGGADRIESIEIVWPDGARQRVDPAGLGIDRAVTIARDGAGG